MGAFGGNVPLPSFFHNSPLQSWAGNKNVFSQDVLWPEEGTVPIAGLGLGPRANWGEMSQWPGGQGAADGRWWEDGGEMEPREDKVRLEFPRAESSK